VPARSPLTTRMPTCNAMLQEVRVQTSWGKGCTRTQMYVTSRSSRWICLPTHIPPSIPGLCIITYTQINCYPFWEQILYKEKFLIDCEIRKLFVFFSYRSPFKVIFSLPPRPPEIQYILAPGDELRSRLPPVHGGV
jgi:hypothetical protein